MKVVEIYILLILTLLSYFYSEIGNFTKEPILTILLSLLILVYVSLKLWHLKKNDPKWYLQPIALSSLFTIILQYVLTNILYANDAFLRILNTKVFITNAEAFYWINFTLFITFGATIAMWLAYDSRLSDRLSLKLTGLLKHFKFRETFEYKPLVISLLLLASVISIYLQLNLGIFGWTKISGSEEFGSISGLLSLLQQLSLFSVLLMSFSYFSGKTKNKLALVSVTIIAMVLGLMHVSKGALILPPILVLFVSMFYKANIRITKMGLILVIMVVFSYLIIEPLRLAISMDKFYNPKNVNSLITNISYSLNYGDRQQLKETLFDRALARQNMLIESAVAIRYKEVVGLDDNSPPFLNHLLLEPFYAFIPRIIWPTKPSMAAYGYWHQLVAHGNALPVSRGMGPIGYLYLSDGILLTFLFFGIIGLLQKIIFLTFYSSNAGKLLIYFILFSNFIPIQTSVNALSYNLLRGFIFTYIFQKIFFKS